MFEDNNNNDNGGNNNGGGDWKERELGALWRVKGRTQDFYSGSVKVNGKVVKIVCFPNKHKEEGSNQPDIRVYESKDEN